MNSSFFKPFILVFVLLMTVGAGCNPLTTGVEMKSPPIPNVQTSSAPEPAPAEEVLTTLTATFEDAELGLRFDYPVAWGEPRVTNELGTVEGKEEVCVYQRSVDFPTLKDAGMILLTAASTDQCDAPGRGGYWGDNASTLSEGQAFMAVCETGEAQICDVVKTKSGESLWHYHFATYPLPFEDSELNDVDEYSLYRAGHTLAGVMISEERLLKYGFDDQQDELRALVDSLELIK